MSHHSPIYSPPGTPLKSRTVGELVAERPGRSRVFQALNIDFCCQGNRTLSEACERKGVPTSTVIEQLEAEQAEKPTSRENPADLPVVELVEHVVKTHHQFLRKELPRLHAMALRVAQVHGGHTPTLVELFEVLHHLEMELASHLQKEEQILFPAIVAMVQDETRSIAIEGPIACMLHEHDDAGQALLELRRITQGFQPPPDACNTYRALFAGLYDLEQDLHRHIHLENAVLFPQARALAEERTKTTA